MRIFSFSLIYFILLLCPSATLMASEQAERLHFWQTWSFWFLVVGVMSYAAGLSYYKVKKYQIAKEEAEKALYQTRLVSLKAQMNPHFIFNALNSIQDFVLTKNPREANRYLSKFSSLMRATLNMVEEENVMLGVEISTLRLYVELELMRFGDDTIYEEEIDPGLPLFRLAIPPMMVQPYVENAFKHGLAPKRDGTRKLSLRFKLHAPSVILVEIEDNGMGRAFIKKAQSTTGHVSKSGTLTEERLRLLNTIRDNKLNVITHDLYTSEGQARGTLVRLYMPFVVMQATSE